MIQLFYNIFSIFLVEALPWRLLMSLRSKTKASKRWKGYLRIRLDKTFNRVKAKKIIGSCRPAHSRHFFGFFVGALKGVELLPGLRTE